MKLQIKKEIKDIMETMLNAHEYVAMLLLDKRVTEARNLLAQCQDCAAYIGETIENSEGMGTRMVSGLEEYCEKLYIMSRTINKKKIIKLKQQLDSMIYRVECEINEAVSFEKIKVVFMPYKAAMWDCMESVWEAAEADEASEVSVVPIPYYERNHQGEIGKKHYEGDMFPTYVPIVPYGEFSLEKECPDIVYIHNPYDGTNYVTSVDPDYYSSNIKKYTGLLVYIPYYILGAGPLPEMHRNLLSYQYIDKIIVQDKDKKESLLEYVPEEKIAVIGSPKVDHLLKINKQKKEFIEHHIPQEWKKKINGKKVVLYNVSISGILQNSKYAMNKIKYILSELKEYENVVVLWRPHPLIESTLKSMRPEMYDEYISIKKEFIHEGKGIFDETGDAGIAVAIADAYLGENTSSLVHYFGVLGKPVLYIDWAITKDVRRKTRDFLYVNSFIWVDDNILFLPSNKGIAYELYQLDLKTGIIKKYMTLPGMPKNVARRYSQIKKIKSKIVLIPYNTADMYVYDMDSKQAMKIVLPNIESDEALFSGAVEYKGKLFLIPTTHHAIICVDIMKNRVLCEYRDCIKSFFSNAWMFTYAYLIREQYLYLAACSESRILVLNMDNGSYKIKKIGEYTYGYHHMIYDGKYFWLAAGGINHIVRWDEKSGDTREYTYPVSQEYPMKNVWSLLVNNGDQIIVYYGFSADMAIMNKETGECQWYESMDDISIEMSIEMGNELNSGLPGFVFADYFDEETIIAISWRDCSFNMWNIGTNQKKKIMCRLSAEEILRVEKEQIERWWIWKTVPYSLSENNVTIRQFIDYIAAGNVNEFNNTYESYIGDLRDLPIGIRVHEYIKGEYV